MESSGGGSLGTLALVVLGPICCLGLPLLLAVGIGSGLWIIGAAIPIVLVAIVGGLVIGRWWRFRSIRSRAPSRPATGALTHDRR